MPLDKPRAEFRQAADLLRAAIDAGEYPPGSRLPPEPVLATRFDVGDRGVINNAVRLLRAEGRLQVVRGKGTFVKSIPVIHRDATGRYNRAARERAGARGAFDAEIRAIGLEPHSDVSVGLSVPPVEVAEVLGVPAGEANVIARTRKMYAGVPGGAREPVQLAVSYIPAEIAADTQLAEEDSGPGGIISRFAELGYPQVRITESVKSRRPTPQEETFLQTDPDQFVNEIFHVGWTAEGRAVEVCVHVVPATLWTLDSEWSIDS